MVRFLVAALVLGLLASDAEAAPKRGGKGGKGGRGGKGGADKRELTMEQGTLQAGGSITADIYTGGGATEIGVTVAPQGGYFVADQVELLAEVQLASLAGATSWQVAAGGRYFIDADPLWAYVGATVGYGQVSFGPFASEALIVNVLPGVIYPLARNVGLDLGARVQIANADGATSVVIPIGYLGVQAFFK